MSLINDALKRAKEANEQSPPPSGPEPEFRPAEPAAVTKTPSGSNTKRTILLTVVAVLCGVAGWQWYRTSRPAPKRPVVVAGKTNAALAKATLAGKTNTVASVKLPVQGQNAAQNSSPFSAILKAKAKTDAVIGIEKQRQAEMAPVERGDLAAKSPTPAPSANPKATAASPVAPANLPPLKLQGILYDPTRPAALINGRTVFVDGTVDEMKVMAINQTSVTLSGFGNTNVVLTMAP